MGALANGALLQEAEAAGFEVFITADKNIRYQQNLTDALEGCTIATIGPPT